MSDQRQAHTLTCKGRTVSLRPGYRYVLGSSRGPLPIWLADLYGRQESASQPRAAARKVVNRVERWGAL